jgi:hypothetical protein
MGHVPRMGEMCNVYVILVGKPEGMSPLGRSCVLLRGYYENGSWGNRLGGVSHSHLA